jgi:hypothetical protein
VTGLESHAPWEEAATKNSATQAMPSSIDLITEFVKDEAQVQTLKEAVPKFLRSYKITFNKKKAKNNIKA